MPLRKKVTTKKKAVWIMHQYSPCRTVTTRINDQSAAKEESGPPFRPSGSIPPAHGPYPRGTDTGCERSQLDDIKPLRVPRFSRIH